MNCVHAVLRLASGGFYVVCTACGGRWTAEKTTDKGSSPDYDRVSHLLDGVVYTRKIR